MSNSRAMANRFTMSCSRSNKPGWLGIARRQNPLEPQGGTGIVKFIKGKAGTGRVGLSSFLSQSTPDASALTLNHFLFDFRNRLRRIQILGTSVCTVHDRMTTIKTERVFQLIEPLTLCVVPCICDPPPCIQKNSRPHKPVRIPPIARTRRRTAKTKNTSRWSTPIFSIQNICVLRALKPFTRGLGRICL